MRPVAGSDDLCNQQPALLEAAMMTCLWQWGQATVSEVYKELTTQRDLAYATVKNVMERVSEKGYLSCNTRQRAYVYTPTQSREAFMRQVSDTILNGLFQDFGAIIEAHLLEETVRQCDLDALDHLHHGALYGTLATDRFA